MWFSNYSISFNFLAAQINNELCDKFSVSRFPMLFWGPSSKFVGAGWKPEQNKSDICTIDDGRTAERLLNWINKKMGRYSSSLPIQDYTQVRQQISISFLLICFLFTPSPGLGTSLTSRCSMAIELFKYLNLIKVINTAF